MDKLRGQPTEQQQQQLLDQYPKNAIYYYLRASTKIRKIERNVFFKRFAPNVHDLKEDFKRMAYEFENTGILQYAAMCHIGIAKCEFALQGEPRQAEVEEYMFAARDFRLAHNEYRSMNLRTGYNGFLQGALHCYNRAAERAANTGVYEAAVLRELKPLQRELERTSSFVSPAHRIHDLEMSTEMAIASGDYRNALQHLDDIVDNIYERRVRMAYEEMLRRVEVMRVLLLVHLNLPPAQQSPDHIMLIEHYYLISQFEIKGAIYCEADDVKRRDDRSGDYVPVLQQYGLAEIICAWVKHKMSDLKQLLRDFSDENLSLSVQERQLISEVYAEKAKHY